MATKEAKDMPRPRTTLAAHMCGRLCQPGAPHAAAPRASLTSAAAAAAAPAAVALLLVLALGTAAAVVRSGCGGGVQCGCGCAGCDGTPAGSQPSTPLANGECGPQLLLPTPTPRRSPNSMCWWCPCGNSAADSTAAQKEWSSAASVESSPALPPHACPSGPEVRHPHAPLSAAPQL